jgi:hypothetical protein
MLAVSLAVVAGACGREGDERGRREEPPPRAPRGSGPPATEAECAAAATGALGSPGGTGLGPAIDGHLRTEREKVIVHRCRADAWPADAALCYAEAQSLHDLGGCWLDGPASTKLTRDLQDVMRRELRLPDPR